MFKKITKLIKLPASLFIYYVVRPIRQISDILLNNELKNTIINSKNPLNKYGKRCFSQCDEDGITLEIIKRLKIKNGTFLEIGCGNGLQNNTLILAANKWKGIWADIKDLAFNYSDSNKLVYFKQFVSEKNILEIINSGLKKLNKTKLDCISIDIDGADFYIIKKILEEKISPKFFIVEIKQQFPPPIEFVAKNFSKYDGEYNGASLTSYNNLFNQYGFTLVCVSSVLGHNAFFVKDEFLEFFKDVPNDILDIYITPNYHSFSYNFKTAVSPKIVEQIFNEID